MPAPRFVRRLVCFATALALTQAIETAGSLATEAVREALAGLNRLTGQYRILVHPPLVNRPQPLSLSPSKAAVSRDAARPSTSSGRAV